MTLTLTLKVHSFSYLCFPTISIPLTTVIKYLRKMFQWQVQITHSTIELEQISALLAIPRVPDMVALDRSKWVISSLYIQHWSWC